METGFGRSTTKKPGLSALQALSSWEHCLTMSLPYRSQNVPWSKKLNMVEAKLKIHVSVVLDPPSTEVGGLEEMFPILPSPRLNQLTQGALRLPPWVKLREASLFLREKGKETATPTYLAKQPLHPTTYFLCPVTPWRSPFPQLPFPFPSRKTTQWMKTTHLK